ncbi:MAG: hypothetical protein ACR2JY_06715 [Chloroflexota bacterium]
MLFKYKVVPTNDEVKADNLKGGWDYMVQANAAAMDTPSWNAVWFQNKPQWQKIYQDLYVQASSRSPFVDKPAAEFGFSRMVVLNSATKVADAAYQCAAFQVADDAAVQTGAWDGSGMPAFPSKFPLWLKTEGNDQGQDLFTKNVTAGHSTELLQTNPTANDQVWKLLNTGWADVLTQKQTVSTFIAIVGPQIQTILDQAVK